MKNYIDKISLKSGLTQTEIKTFLFVFIIFVIGLIVKTVKNDSFESSPQKFNYSAYDSLFNRVNEDYRSRVTTDKNNEKRVDSQAELYDFSTDKKDSKKNNSFLLKLKSIDINAADERILIKLPGIGKSIAERILLLRKKKGEFRNLKELMQVKGIGIKKLENINILLYQIY